MSRRLTIGGLLEEWLPLELLDRGTGTLLLEITFESAHRNAAGMVHGGFVMSALDITRAGAAVAIPEASARLFGITLSMTTSFLAPVPPGPLYCAGHVTGGGRTHRFADARLFAAGEAPRPTGHNRSADETVYATATGTIRVVDLDRASPVPASA